MQRVLGFGVTLCEDSLNQTPQSSTVPKTPLLAEAREFVYITILNVYYIYIYIYVHINGKQGCAYGLIEFLATL